MSLVRAAVAAWARQSRGRQDRLIACVTAVPAAAVLGVARALEPDVAGVGTHTQLGLGACAVLSVTGWPCPMCGMTTTFTHLAHGAVASAITTQPFGVILFSVTALIAGTGLADIISPRARLRRLAAWAQVHEVGLSLFALLGMASGWAYKAWVMGCLAGECGTAP